MSLIVSLLLQLFYSFSRIARVPGFYYLMYVLHHFSLFTQIVALCLCYRRLSFFASRHVRPLILAYLTSAER